VQRVLFDGRMILETLFQIRPAALGKFLIQPRGLW
jgi:hypothetical protein